MLEYNVFKSMVLLVNFDEPSATFAEGLVFQNQGYYPVVSAKDKLARMLRTSLTRVRSF
jgi:hypothetical protein